MARLSFRDIHGQYGFVTDDLEVEYSGSWKPSVSRYVDQVRDEADPADGDDGAGDLFDRLIIEMPEQAPIVAVEREEAMRVTAESQP